MSSSNNSTNKTSRFKSFIRGVSAQPSLIPQQNYKNLKYVKESVTKSTSNTSIASNISNNSNSITQTIQDSSIEMNTKRRFASLKSISLDSFSINSINNGFKRDSRESSLLNDQFNANSNASFGSLTSQQQPQMTKSNIKQLPFMRGKNLLSTRPKSAIDYNSFTATSTLPNKRNSSYETSRISELFLLNFGFILTCLLHINIA